MDGPVRKRMVSVMAVVALASSSALAGCDVAALRKSHNTPETHARVESKAPADLKAAGVEYLRIVKPGNDYAEKMANVSISTPAEARKDCQTMADLLADQIRELHAYTWPTPKVDSLIQTLIDETARERSVWLGCTSATSLSEYDNAGTAVDNLPATGTTDLIRLELNLPPVPAVTGSSRQ